VNARRYGGPGPAAYGHRPEPTGMRRGARPFAELAGRLPSAAQLPRSVDLRPLVPAIMDQGAGPTQGTSSCEGHRWASSLVVACAAAGDPLPWVPSPKGIYTLARALDRAAFPEGPSEPLGDNGATSGSAQAGVEQWGVWRMQSPTRDGRNSDCEVKTINEELQLGDLLAGARRLYVGAHPVDGADLTTDVCRVLAGGRPVQLDVYVDAAVEDWLPSRGPLGRPNKRDKNGGWHAIYLCGYERRLSGLVDFRWVNSWGESWGEQGFGLGDEAWLAAAEQHVAVDVRRAGR